MLHCVQLHILNNAPVYQGLSRWRGIRVLFEVNTVLFTKEKFEPGKCRNTKNAATCAKFEKLVISHHRDNLL